MIQGHNMFIATEKLKNLTNVTIYKMIVCNVAVLFPNEYRIASITIFIMGMNEQELLQYLSHAVFCSCMQRKSHGRMFVSLCILHQPYLTVTAGTANCPILGRLGSSLHLLSRELGSLTAWGWLSEHRAYIYSVIQTACQPDQITSLNHAWHPCGTLQQGLRN